MSLKTNLEEYSLCFRGLVKYPDCNSTENLFGGKLLLWLDESVAIFASRYMNAAKVVTARFESMDFEVPTEIRKVVSIYAKVTKEGNSSLTVHAIATKSNMDGSEEVEVAQTSIVFVSVDSNGKSTPWNKHTNSHS
jgi:acyl-CoA thioesterase YciA